MTPQRRCKSVRADATCSPGSRLRRAGPARQRAQTVKSARTITNTNAPRRGWGTRKAAGLAQGKDMAKHFGMGVGTSDYNGHLLRERRPILVVGGLCVFGRAARGITQHDLFDAAEHEFAAHAVEIGRIEMGFGADQARFVADLFHCVLDRSPTVERHAAY